MPLVMETPEQQQDAKSHHHRDTTMPTFKVELPGGGRFGYPQAVEARPLKVGELKALSLSAGGGEDSFWSQLKAAAQACLLSKGVSVEELTVQDFVAYLIALRINSLGPRLDLLVTCPRCNKSAPVTVNLLELEPRPVPEALTEPATFPSGYKAYMPRVKDLNLLTSDEWEVVRAALRVSEEEFEELPALVAAEARQWLSEVDFGYDLMRQVKCPACGSEIRFVVPIVEFFR